MKTTPDVEMRIVTQQYPNQFESEVNRLLREGRWRVASIEMSVTDHHYFAVLVRSQGDHQTRQLPYLEPTENILYEEDVKDSHGMFDANRKVLTIPVTGWYLIKYYGEENSQRLFFRAGAEESRRIKWLARETI